MTTDEIKVELAHWTRLIDNATFWGSEIVEAEEFKQECIRELHYREYPHNVDNSRQHQLVSLAEEGRMGEIGG